MDLLTLLLLSTALVPVTSSPIVPSEAERSEPFHLAISTAAPGSISHDTSSLPTPAPVAQLSGGNGVPMKPILGRREALNLDPPNLSPLDMAIVAPYKGCTTTTSETYGYPCEWDGTTTLYPSTTVLFKQINCNGCENVYVHRDIYYCPNQRINGTLKAGVPSTSWSTICSQSAALARRAEPDTPASTTGSDLGALPTDGPKGARSPAEGIQPAACPTTLVVQPPRVAGKTATSYLSFTTTTALVSCGGCPLVISTALVGLGPPVAFETTTTLPVGAVTTYACR
ncbi:hypothetical protein C8A01DRAFT_18480 [Parachaetomium inaequale]|uniref:Uncharacterized protein n=1 Tax=Parachaetomium inaequale TaxID=2588326 RepID=A0AAN6SPJ2_9PEZI|nr:hypothetical protein C8A01DRAFT_18480 [Parachaetomium inaequale]